MRNSFQTGKLPGCIGCEAWTATPTSPTCRTPSGRSSNRSRRPTRAPVGHASTRCAHSSMPCSTTCAPAVPGSCCLRTGHRGRRSATSSARGDGMGHGSAFTPCCGGARGCALAATSNRASAEQGQRAALRHQRGVDLPRLVDCLETLRNERAVAARGESLC